MITGSLNNIAEHSIGVFAAMDAAGKFDGLVWTAGVIIEAFVGGVAAWILFLIVTNKILLFKLISEQNGDASLSRLQFLIFTLVISMSLFFVIATKNDFPTSIPPEIYALLGISGGSYVISKGIQFSNPAGLATPALSIAPTTAGPAGGPVTFVASMVNAAPGALMPALTWSLDAPAHGTLAPQPPNNAIFTPDPAVTGATVTVRVQTNGYNDGTALYTYPPPPQQA